jgi:hypothetical protein
MTRQEAVHHKWDARMFSALLMTLAAVRVAVPAREVATDSVPTVGVAARLADGSICLAAPDRSLKDGTILHAIQVPLDSAAPSGAVLSLRVENVASGSCANLWGLPGDTAYAVTAVAAEGAPEPGLPMVVLLDARWLFHRTGEGWHIDNHRGDPDLVARACTSSEGIHLTFWAGQPLAGRLVWHRYFYLGYDVESSCTNADYGNAQLPNRGFLTECREGPQQLPCNSRRGWATWSAAEPRFIRWTSIWSVN